MRRVPLSRLTHQIPPKVLKRATEREITSVQALLTMLPFELSQSLDLDYRSAVELLTTASRIVCPVPNTAAQLAAAAAGQHKLPTTLPSLDRLFSGGLAAGFVTEIVGAPGLGKTQFCFSTTVSALLGRVHQPRVALLPQGTVLWIDTEGAFSAERLQEIALHRFPHIFSSQSTLDELLRRVTIVKISTLVELSERLGGLQEFIIASHCQLIVLDSMAALARSGYGVGEIAQRQQLLARCAAQLKYLASTFNLPILVTNQVGGQPQAQGQELEREKEPPEADAQPDHTVGTVHAALGMLWYHAANTRIALEPRTVSNLRLRLDLHRQTVPNRRGTLVVVKSPICPQTALNYAVAASGLIED